MQKDTASAPSLLPPPRGSRLRRALRIFAYVAALNVLLAALIVSFAHAAAEKRVQRAGLELLAAVGPRFVGEPQAMLINGQPMFLASKTVAEGVGAVLDHFEAYCAGESGSSETGQASAKAGAPVEGWDPYVWLRSRLEEGDAGHIACFVPKSRAGGVKALVERVSAFVTTGDLAEFGQVRYAVARRNAEANATHVLSMWTEGSFNVLAMFPENGDAPGSDALDIPRPGASRRVLSAEVPGQPYALRLYDSDEPHASVLESYGTLLGARHWRGLPLPVEPDSYDMNQNVRVFLQGSRALIVSVSDTPAGKTSVSLLELMSLGFAQVTAKVASTSAAGATR